MTRFTYDSFPATLRGAVPGFDRVYDEHVADYDEPLPHVLLGDLVRFLSNEVELHGSEATALRQAMPLLEQAMEGGDARLEELIAVSFVENLRVEDPSFPVIRSLLGPRLEEQLKRFEQADLSDET
jgi:hypothetical protein